MQLGLYVGASLAVALATIYQAYAIHRQFYPTVVYLSNSNASLLVFWNLFFLGMYGVHHLIRLLFLGKLRESEREHVNEQLKIAVTETLLGMAIFRDEFNGHFVLLFSVMLFWKSFHWLALQRVEFFQQMPVMTVWQHVRLSVLLLSLIITDTAFAYYYFNHYLVKGPSVVLLFCFEYSLLVSTAFSTIFKYVIYAVDNHYNGMWEARRIVMFYVEFIFDLINLVMFLVFFSTIASHYGLPLHIIREFYNTIRSIFTHVKRLLTFRRIMAGFDQRFPDVTPEELAAAADRTCIICREDMERAKKLRCGHMFHPACLRTWLERNEICPTCRAPLDQPPAQQTPNARQPNANQNPAANPNQNPNQNLPNGGHIHPGDNPFYPHAVQQHAMQFAPFGLGPHGMMIPPMPMPIIPQAPVHPPANPPGNPPPAPANGTRRTNPLIDPSARSAPSSSSSSSATASTSTSTSAAATSSSSTPTPSAGSSMYSSMYPQATAPSSMPQPTSHTLSGLNFFGQQPMMPISATTNPTSTTTTSQQAQSFAQDPEFVRLLVSLQQSVDESQAILMQLRLHHEHFLRSQQQQPNQQPQPQPQPQPQSSSVEHAPQSRNEPPQETLSVLMPSSEQTSQPLQDRRDPWLPSAAAQSTPRETEETTNAATMTPDAVRQARLRRFQRTENPDQVD